MDAARSGSRYGHRDSTMILIAYRHGLRASELCDLQWSQFDLNAGTLRVRRRKQGSPGTHPLQDDEIRALRRLQRGRFVFLTERDGPMTPKAFHALFARIGQRAELPFPVHPYMLRHTCGYLLANKGHDTRSLQAYLGHKNIQHTVRYTELAPSDLYFFGEIDLGNEHRSMPRRPVAPRPNGRSASTSACMVKR